ncbi:MAG: WG repeat-containing protein [Candidatus Thiodiazotropha sp.]
MKSFVLALVLIAFLSGCVTTNKRISEQNFSPLTEESFSARKKPPEIMTLSGVLSQDVEKTIIRKNLIVDGYALIGTLKHEEILHTCEYISQDVDPKCKNVGNPEAAITKIQKDAGEKGADHVTIYKLGTPIVKQRTDTVCIQYKTVVDYTHVYKANGLLETTGRSRDACAKYGPIPSAIFDSIQVYGADVFRYHPTVADWQKDALLIELAIARDDIKSLEEILKSGVDVNTKTISGHVPMTVAALLGNLEAAKLLLDYGADINHMTRRGTPLHNASKLGQAEFVKYLLENGADTDLVNDSEEDWLKGMNALHYAAYNASLNVLKLLLDSGMNVDVRTGQGMTPLMYAAMMDNEYIVKELLKHGASIEAVYKEFDNNNKHVLRQWTPLAIAVNNNSVAAVKALLDNGANLGFVMNASYYKKNTIGDFARTLYRDEGVNHEVWDAISVFKYGKWGFLKHNGQYVIEPKYSAVNSFSEGLAAVRMNGKWGYINKNGQYVLEAKYYNAGSFVNGVAPVNIKPLTWTLINKTGEYLIKPRHGTFITGINEGKIAIRNYKEWVIYDLNGVEITRPKGTWSLYKYSEGLLVNKVSSVVSDKPQYEILDEKGGIVYKTKKGKYDYISDYSDGLAIFKSIEKKKWGYFDRQGNVAIQEKFDNANSFRDGKAEVRLGDKYCLIDKSGQVINATCRGEKINWDRAREGVYYTIVNGKCGYSSLSDNKQITPHKYELCFPFSENIAAVKVSVNSDKWQFIKKNGKLLSNKKFDSILSFSEGLAGVNVK